MVSMLASIDGTIATFFESLTASLGFGGYLLVALAVEAVLVIVYGIKSAFSYEARFKRVINKTNAWLHANKKLTPENIKEFTNLLKKAPKRVSHFWQRYIMYREGGPGAYLSEENIVEKPLRTSSWLNNVKNLGIATVVWTICSAIMGFAAQANKIWSFSNAVTALSIPLLVAVVGAIAIITIKGCRAYNLQDVYEAYHIFIRFLTNACDELPPYIELDLLFTKKELSKASRELKEFYETNARKAKKAFEEARRSEEQTVEYNFKEVGVDGALLLDRAMKESENYINKKTKVQSQIAQVEAQKDAMRRNFENIQMDLQRKIQASKENIQKLIEQQAATTSRIEVGLLRQQQDKEAKKLDELQRDYDKEETRFRADRDEHDKEIARLKEIKEESLQIAERGMTAEYQSFFEKVMRSAYAVADKRVEKEKKELIKQNDAQEQELINVQTQIKRLLDENVTLRAKLGEYNPEFRNQDELRGKYDKNGNYVYEDGSYHDEQGLFHSENGDVYNMNGEKVSKDYTDEEVDQNEREQLVKDQIDQFGSYIQEEQAAQEEQQPVAEEFVENQTQAAEEPKKTPIIEDFVWDEEEPSVAEEPKQEELPIDDAFADEAEEDTVDEEPAISEELVAVEQPAEQPAETEKKTTGKKRGRPRKVVAVVETPARKRGRPRKEETQAVAQPKQSTKPAPRKRVAKKEEPAVESPAKKRGRPRKEEVVVKKERPKPRKRVAKKEEPVVTEAPAKKRGRPRKTEVVEETAPAKKRGRPRKNTSEEVGSIARINQLISEEEEKLNKMKAFLSSEIDQVMTEESSNADKEKENLAKEFEELKTKANNAKKTGSSEELVAINKKLEALIKEINALNNK